MGEQIRDRTSSATVVGIILSGLIALMAVGYLYVRITANESYALIHMLMELVGIVVAAGAFMIAWNTRRTMGNSYVLVVALAGAFVAGVDLLHALTYQGMNLIPHVGNNLPTQLWLVGRYLQAASLFIAPLFVIRRAAPAKVMWGFGVATFVLLGSIALGVFPDAYIEPTGLTGFKIASEYVISLAMALGLAGLISMRREQDREVLGFMATAIGCFIAAELVFTLYGRPTAPLNYAGHMLRVAGALFLYRALVVAAITRPFDVLFRDLKQAADGLERSERRFRSTFDQAILGILEIDLGGRIVRANRRMHAFGEYRGSELSGVEASQLTDTKDRASEAELFAALAQGTIQEYRLEKRMITASGSKLWVNAIRSSVLGGDGETRYYIEMAEDISTRREAEGRLERSRGLKSSISKIDSSINSTFDIEEIISTAVAEGAEAIGADSAIVTMHEQHGWELRKAWHFPPHDVAPEVPSGRITELVSLETDGLPLVIEDVDDDPRVNVEVARLFGVRSFIVIPLRFRGRSLGMLFFNYSSGPRDFDEDEIAFAVELSSALTMAIENARLYDAEHRTVDAIQASLLAIEGDIPGVEVGTAYYSAVELARIGGDFFDVFALPDDRVAFAVGDV
ncbi:MAG: PAS domain S-box protein, partial [Coriobacteriia bacterium]|nr:PAS domain S-box protein [Coriobacteriia bacterium]